MYKSRKRQLAYLREWRKKNPAYMSDYYWREVKPLAAGKRSPALAGAARPARAVI